MYRNNDSTSKSERKENLPGGAPRIPTGPKRPIVVVENPFATVQYRDENPDYPTIDTTGPIFEQNEGALKALALQPDVYKKAGTGLVYVLDGHIHLMKRGVLRDRLSRICCFEKPAKRGADNAMPPREVLDYFTDSPDLPGMRELIRISSIPIMRADGTLFRSGYDAETKILVELAPDLVDITVPEHPTKGQAIDAAKRLKHLMGGVRTDEQGRSVLLSLNLSLAGRGAITGPCPAHVFDAAEAEAGKTYAARAPYGAVYGKECIIDPIPQQSPDWAKSTPKWSNQAMVLFDNIKTGSSFGCADFDRIVTSMKESTRKLTTHDGIDSDLSGTVFSATGINLTYEAETRSRCIVARLMKLPRKASDSPPDDAFYLAHRRQALTDSFTILRAYIVAGKPAQAGKHIRFDAWRKLVQGAILWLGFADPVGAGSFDMAVENKHSAITALIELVLHLYKTISKEFKTSELELEPNPAYGSVETDKLRNRARNALGQLLGRKVVTNEDVGYALNKLRDVDVEVDAPYHCRLLGMDYAEGAEMHARLELTPGSGKGKGNKYLIVYHNSVELQMRQEAQIKALAVEDAPAPELAAPELQHAQDEHEQAAEKPAEKPPEQAAELVQGEVLAFPPEQPPELPLELPRPARRIVIAPHEPEPVTPPEPTFIDPRWDDRTQKLALAGAPILRPVFRSN